MEGDTPGGMSTLAGTEAARAGPVHSSPTGRLVRAISGHERIAALLTFALFLLSWSYQAWTAPLWFDEFFTLFISRLSSFGQMLRVMPADGQPPLQYVLTHFSLEWLGQTPFVLRLPELLAYTAAGVLTWRIIRRHGNPVQALFGCSMLMGCFVGGQAAYTARPYGLLLAFCTLTFASWQSAALRRSHRALPLCGVSIGIAGAVMSHHFGVVDVGWFLVAGEAVRFNRCRRLDGWMLAAIAAGLMPLVLTLPLAHQSQLLLGEPLAHSTNLAFRPKLEDLSFYLLLFPVSLLLLVIVLLPLPCRDGDFNGADSQSPVPAHEWAAAVALSLILPLQIVLGVLAIGTVATRYVICASLGIALIAAWGLPRLPLSRGRIQAALCIGTLTYLLTVAVSLVSAQIHEPVWRARAGGSSASPLLRDAGGGSPVVVASAYDYLPEWWYSQGSIRQRLIYLADVAYAVKQKDFLPELSLVDDKAIVPAPVADYAAFTQHHSSFLLLCAGEPRYIWLPARLAAAGWRLDPIARSGRDVLYRVSRVR
jgi:hypothetical protein